MRNFNAIKLGKGIRGKKSGDYNSTWPQLQISNRHLIPDKIISRVAGLTIHSDRVILPNGTTNGQGGQKMRRPAQPRQEGRLFSSLKAQEKESLKYVWQPAPIQTLIICPNWLPLSDWRRAYERCPHIGLLIGPWVKWMSLQIKKYKHLAPISKCFLKLITVFWWL